jgi:predicted DNA-binding antitoxin AbrB/MazE fold protein
MYGRFGMVKTIEAVYDGAVFHPANPLALEPNIRVRLTIETFPQITESAESFLRVACSLDLDGPTDWATNLEAYLYDREGIHGE